MQQKTIDLKAAADRAKALHMAGEITYDECVAACKAYVDHANEIGKRIAKEHGMKPKLISVRGYMR